MGVSDVVVAAVEPANKLIEAVSGAIGKAYEPRYIRKMADAKAYELKTINDELRNNADLPIIYDANGKFSVDMSDYEALTKRAGRRIAYQEVMKQENIESIVDSAYDDLKGSAVICDGEISREWMNRFIDSAGDVSTEELQKLWSKVLAGEVLSPKSFSLRTLDCLRNLDVTDAKLFQTICELIIENHFIPSDEGFLDKHGFPFRSILKLDESGLINASGSIVAKKSVNSRPRSIFDFGKYVLIGKSEIETMVSVPEYPLTSAGRELCAITVTEKKMDVIKDLCRLVAQQNRNVIFSLHEIIDRESEEYKETSIDF